jgi:hypothetical protein
MHSGVTPPRPTRVSSRQPPEIPAAPSLRFASHRSLPQVGNERRSGAGPASSSNVVPACAACLVGAPGRVRARRSVAEGTVGAEERSWRCRKPSGDNSRASNHPCRRCFRSGVPPAEEHWRHIPRAIPVVWDLRRGVDACRESRREACGPRRTSIRVEPRGVDSASTRRGCSSPTNTSCVAGPTARSDSSSIDGARPLHWELMPPRCASCPSNSGKSPPGLGGAAARRVCV